MYLIGVKSAPCAVFLCTYCTLIVFFNFEKKSILPKKYFIETK